MLDNQDSTSPLATPTSELPPSNQTQTTSVSHFQVGRQAAPMTSKKNWLAPLLVGGLVLIFALAFGLLEYQRQVLEASKPTPLPAVEATVVLNYWGLWEHNDTLDDVFRQFEQENPGVTVQYFKKNIYTYRQELEDALTVHSQNAPDIFRFHLSWRSVLEASLDNLPLAVMTPERYETDFYPVARAALSDRTGQIKGLPLMYDALALVYNQDILAAAGIEAPQSWPEFRLRAKELTVYDEDTGKMIQAGAAMGLAENVDFAPDIIGLYATQEGIDWLNPDPEILAHALEYFTSFYLHPDSISWSRDFNNSTQAFAAGDVAMILAPSWLIHDILALNPRLAIGVAPAPQLNESNPKEWATFWVEGVNAASPRKLAAWHLLEFLSRPAILEVLYQEQSARRNFGEIYPRPAMADLLAQDQYVHAYLVNASRAVSFPFNDKTFDHGFNEQLNAEVVKAISALTDERQGYRGTPESGARRILQDYFDILILYNYLADE